MAIKIADVVESKGAGRCRPSRLGPYSGVGAIAALDGRSCEYRYYKKCRDELLSYVGGEPTAIQRELAEQAAWCKLRIGMLNKRMVEDVGAVVADGSDSQWVTALSRILVLLDFTRGQGGELAGTEARLAAFEALHNAPRGGSETMISAAGND
jgi:hypothetical protein